MSDPHVAEITRTIRSQWSASAQGTHYAIVDSAQDQSLAVAVKEAGSEYRSLFDGPAAAAMESVAPLVTPLQDDSALWHEFAQRWDCNVGVLVSTAARLEDVVGHLRQIFVVQDETGQEFFFRFYDPRVLRNYLPTCEESELREFFGPVTAICCSGEQPDSLVIYQIEGGKLQARHHTWQGQPSPSA